MPLTAPTEHPNLGRSGRFEMWVMVKKRRSRLIKLHLLQGVSAGLHVGKKEKKNHPPNFFNKFLSFAFGLLCVTSAASQKPVFHRPDNKAHILFNQ